MRVLVASDQVGALTSLQAGAALASAWAEVAGADCAVVALGAAGTTWLSALADEQRTDVRLLPTDVTEPIALGVGGDDIVGVALEPGAFEPGIPAAASSLPLGRTVADALTAWPGRPRLAIDLTWAGASHDAGAGLLAALGAVANVALDGGALGLAGLTGLDLAPVRERLAGVELVGVVAHDELDQRLLGLRGISAARGHRAQLDLAVTMAADAALERWANLVDPAAAALPGAGACGGAGYAVLALGGHLLTGPAQLAERSGLAATLRRADLVVAGCTRFAPDLRGGDVVTHLAAAAGEAGVPLLVVADEVLIGAREMRTFGVEAAHALELGDPGAEDLARVARAVATSWRW